MLLNQFENDVKMYGTETRNAGRNDGKGFENDVKMYGTETVLANPQLTISFENDVKMYGTETEVEFTDYNIRLRMM